MLSIIIPVWNNWHLTKRCLQDIIQLPDDHEIIVVNNGSTDDTKKELEKFARVRTINLDKNMGFGFSVNVGYQLSKGDIVMFLNNDIRVSNDFDTWTSKIIEKASEDGLVGPTVGLIDKNFNFVTEAKKVPSKGHPYMSGWNLTAKRSVWKQLIEVGDVGPFSTEFFVYFEDTDLGMRARELDIPFHVVDVPVKHLGKMTSKKLDTSKLFIEARNIFVKKWIGRADKILKG